MWLGGSDASSSTDEFRSTTWRMWVTIDGIRLVRVAHTVTDEPTAIGRVNDLAGWLSSIENRALHHGTKCRRNDTPIEREPEHSMNL